MELKKKISEAFASHFGGEGTFYSSAGRINLIGEHTDYNGGFVFPGAIDKVIMAEIRPNDTEKVNLYSVDMDASASFGCWNSADPAVIAIDSIYTPIKNVKYSVENYRVEQKTDYEKLILEVTTDGSILPKDALKEAAKILIYHFMLFSDEKMTMETKQDEDPEEFDEEVLHMRQLLKTKLSDMDLSVRALNCLKSAEVETLGELVVFNKNDLLKFRNFGRKSLTELDDLLANLNLTFGMDISKYKLDKE